MPDTKEQINPKLEGEYTEEEFKKLKGMKVTLAGQSMDEARREGTYCLLDSITTEDEETILYLQEECAKTQGCNVCLSKITNDEIEWPSHYNHGKIQPIDVIEDWKLDFRLANAVKYIGRAGKKDKTKTKQDLEKAVWYIRRFITKELE